jgi:hypothetical protein
MMHDRCTHGSNAAASTFIAMMAARSTKPTPSQHQANKVKLFKRNRSRGSLQNAENELTPQTRKHLNNNNNTNTQSVMK